MAREPIRLRLVPRETIKHHKNPREEFWHAIKDDELRDQSISKLEAKLCREFGEELRGQLIRHLRRPLDQLLEAQDRNLERWYFRFYDRPRFEKELDRFQIADSLSRIVEQNQNEMRGGVAGVQFRAPKRSGRARSALNI
jgi:hypothetical protein